MRKLLLLTLGLMLFSGCASYVEMTPPQLHELVNGTRGAGSTMWRGTYYCGSDSRYDYFRHTLDTVSDILVKVKAGEVPLAKRLTFPAKKADWVDVSQLLETKR